MTRTLTIAAAALLAAFSVAAQEAITFTPPVCLRSAEMPVMKLNVTEQGQLRGYFRRTTATDWCSVEGKNDGQLSSVTLPKFDSGDEIEYFFLLADGDRIVARSPQIYRARVTDACDNVWARNVSLLAINCGDNGSGSIPASLGAGYAVNRALVVNAPPFASPDSPDASSSAMPRRGSN